MFREIALIRLTFRRMLAVLGCLLLTRLVFIALNPVHMSGYDWLQIWLSGLRFDASALAMLCWPALIFSLLPFPFVRKRLFRNTSHVLFVAGIFAAALFNLIDSEYFKFTGKRSTADLFLLAGTGNDVINLIPRFVSDFWYIPTLTVLITLAAWWLDRLWLRNTRQVLMLPGRMNYVAAGILFLTTNALVVIGIRGGFQERPIHLVTAGRYASPEHTPYVLNTPFCILKTMGAAPIEELHFMDEVEAEQVYPIIHQPAAKAFKPDNICIIILESFSAEYTGYGSLQGFTPFLDSLMQLGRSYPAGIANAKKSIEGVPAILSGIPNLMNDPYLLSPFSGNAMDALPHLLKKKGYHTSFFHGGTNGTMGFDDFCALAGVDHYLGRSEYPVADDYDGHWGIPDHLFFPFFARTLATYPEPFFTTLFSISSHHPFVVPDDNGYSPPASEFPVLPAIAYTDHALRALFNRLKTYPFYQHTLFVITADHTGMELTPTGSTSTGKFRIPILFFHPTDSLPQIRKGIAQQVDIMPSILDYIGYDQPYVAFGNSVFSPRIPDCAITFLNGVYQLITDKYIYQMTTEGSVGLYDLQKDPLQTRNILEPKSTELPYIQKTTQAIVQQYNHNLLYNEMIYRKP
ncbi:MAG: sulfatase-like hydrolase/transferase [Flavobacteriales bacterium]|nr:sulfatase-like hydrolase/transferase [Flavobacteriales bacterium]MCB9448810.1 sulfatase-like hydrolase/transferase [Flavobacteriales bacterium]